MGFFSRNNNRVPGRIRVNHRANNNHETASNGESLMSSEATAQLEDMRGAMTNMERQMMTQNQQMQQMMTQQSKQMDTIMETLDNKDNVDDEANLPIEGGSYEVEWDRTQWSVTGVSSRVPDADHTYFPGLAWNATPVDGPPNDRIISTIIPCYNEEGKDLERTLRGLSRQIMPEGWRVEALIVMDGVTAMSDSMAAFLFSMFGVDFASNDPSLNPFEVLKDANTIIIQPLNQDAAYTRRTVMEGTVGGFSLVVKRENRRKANSQQWWLGPHATAIGCKYALATDCGTYFERLTVVRLTERLDDDIATHAVTGTQRTMPADIQGDGNWELCYNPFHFILRQLQRFEFEVDNVSFMSVYNTIGAMHVIPGPCGLYRYSKMGSLKEGLMHQYFKLFSRSNKGLILGNVELVEDRIPGTLLVFPPKKSSKDANVMPAEGWPKTGLVHDAIFYMEAEKPLSQLVKQRRRWLNGTFATYIWMLREGIISNSNQDPISKTLSLCLIVLGVVQGLVVRMFGPALLIVWMFRFGLFLPDLIADPSKIFDPNLSLVEVESEPGRLLDGVMFGGMYLVLYIAFVIGHTPRAKPVQDEISIVRYTEPSRYKNDSNSAYRGWLFHPVLWINLVVVVLYILNAIGIVATLGWADTPLAVRILILFCFLPFASGILDGVARCNFSGLWNMIVSAPFALPLMIWFTIWLPAYSTTRLSDLTWGNRDRGSLDESEKALTRAENGAKVARFLIGFNTTVAITVIILMQFYGSTFPIFVVTYTLILSATYLISFLEILCRTLGGIGSTTRPSSAAEESKEEEVEATYKKMEDAHSPVRSSGSDDTGNTTDSAEFAEEPKNEADATKEHSESDKGIEMFLEDTA